MKGKHLLIALVIAGMIYGIIGIYFGSVRKEKNYISFARTLCIIALLTSERLTPWIIVEILGGVSALIGFIVVCLE